MKKDIHANYVDTQVKCACGNEFVIKSTTETLNVESCNKCHAAYTGKSKSISAAGRVEKFNKKFGLNK
ncbi:MAG: 50S ribosomal protein L31 [Mycoplasmatales bacterium]